MDIIGRSYMLIISGNYGVITCHQCNSFKTTRDFFCQDLKFLTVGALMFEDQLSPIWYNVWLDPNLRNKTMNLPLELHLLLQYSYVCIRHDSCIQCINSLPRECCSISYMTFVGDCNTVMSSGHWTPTALRITWEE